ncbi:putative ABC-type metal ion transport system, permease component [Pyrodictium delaneyi]|nr:metal ABC transporter permease [Pyrodictium delaneyi]ALL00076.1 putative ABC-type metal ion transport system, permease component [Pyrodictium delaneyi]
MRIAEVVVFVIATILAILSLSMYYVRISVYPALAVLAAGLAFGLLSALVAARKLFFLAGATPHSALLAALLAILVTGSMNTSAYISTIVVTVLLVYMAGYMIFSGVEPDIATSVLVSFSASTSVILAYYAKTTAGGADITSIVFGDPLLVSSWEAWIAVVTALAVCILVVLSYREQIYLGVERDLAKITGMPVWLHDLIFFTMVGVVVSTMVQIVGFVLEHVLILLPGAAASMYARSAREAILLSVSTALIAAGLGLILSLMLGLSPAGATGLVMLLIYVAFVAKSR